MPVFPSGSMADLFFPKIFMPKTFESGLLLTTIIKPLGNCSRITSDELAEQLNDNKKMANKMAKEHRQNFLISPST
jgi:hypothetical protein